MVENPDVIRDQFDFRATYGTKLAPCNRKGRGNDFHLITDFVNAGRVQSIGGFVQDQNRRTPQQCLGKAQALLHSQRVLFASRSPNSVSPTSSRASSTSAFGSPKMRRIISRFFPPGQVCEKDGASMKRADLFENGNPIIRELLPINSKAAPLSARVRPSNIFMVVISPLGHRKP